MYVHGCQIEVLEGEELIFGVKMWIGGLCQELGLFDGQFDGCEDDLKKFRRTIFLAVKTTLGDLDGQFFGLSSSIFSG